MSAQNSHRRLDQRGVASLIITMVTMVIISLIVIGFATISRREQRQSLDQQLSTQAFYAAESGVEDAKSVIRAAQNAGQSVPAKAECTTDPTGKYPTGDKTILSAEFQVSYTCLTVDPSPKSLQFNGVSDSSIVVPVNTDLPITSIRLTWTPTAAPSMPSTNCPNSVDHTLRQQSNWNCGYGMVRADMTPADPLNGPLTRNKLIGDSITSFFEPVTAVSTGVVDYPTGKTVPNLIGARCAASGPYGTCQATINNISAATNITNLSLRLTSLYQSSNIKIEALNGNAPQKIKNVQAVIDSTGKATDVLRRIQVRLPVTSNGILPGYALQSNSSICKHFTSSSNYFEISGVIDPDPSNAMCNPTTDGTIPVCTAYNDVEFVLDHSGSMREKWQTTTKIAKLIQVTNLFIQNAKFNPAQNHAGIIQFDNTADVLATLTGDVPTLTAAVNSIQPGSGTFYGTGLTAAARELSGPNARVDAKKIMIFISDGEPTDNVAADVAQANAMKASGVQIYTIGISNDLGNGRQVLTDMAGNGGRFGDASQEQDLTDILNSITLDLACENPTP